MKVILTASLCASILAQRLAHARPDEADALTFGEMLKASGVILTGLIDTWYTYLSGAGRLYQRYPESHVQS
jgi:hypothetical protein